jgi:hypothetical protein
MWPFYHYSVHDSMVYLIYCLSMVPILLLPPNILHILEDIFRSGFRPNLRLSNLSGLGLDSDSTLFGLGLDLDSTLYGLGLDSDSSELVSTTTLVIDMLDFIQQSYFTQDAFKGA